MLLCRSAATASMAFISSQITLQPNTECFMEESLSYESRLPYCKEAKNLALRIRESYKTRQAAPVISSMQHVRKFSQYPTHPSFTTLLQNFSALSQRQMLTLPEIEGRAVGRLSISCLFCPSGFGKLGDESR